jgi:hemerythrin-like domain-containing protein
MSYVDSRLEENCQTDFPQTAHAAIYIANEMAFAHNAMLRGLNSIYLQAPNIHEAHDIADFLFFVKSWAGWVSHHHVLEEEQMFPGFEKVIGQTGFLEGNVNQHHVFQPALKRMLAYGSNTKPADYDASTLRGIIEEMAPALREHLSDEIQSLLSMRPYDSAALLKVYKECEAEAGKQDKVSPVQLILPPSLTVHLILIGLSPAECHPPDGSGPARCDLRRWQQLARHATAVRVVCALSLCP